jgi:hypothetical protein
MKKSFLNLNLFFKFLFHCLRESILSAILDQLVCRTDCEGVYVQSPPFIEFTEHN